MSVPERQYSEADWIAYAEEPDGFRQWLGALVAGVLAHRRGAAADECPWGDPLRRERWHEGFGLPLRGMPRPPPTPLRVVGFAEMSVPAGDE